MTRVRRIRAEAQAEWYAFTRRRTAVFFTFLFPVILLVIFGALVRTGTPGLFGEPPEYYVPGYLAVVVLFTPLSRISSTVTRYRDGRRFEKLATTPLTPTEWLLAHTLINLLVVVLASLIVLVLAVLITNAAVTVTPWLAVTITLGTLVFCGFGAIIGRLAGSQDGAIAASNTIGLPLVFLSDTFVPPSMLPDWFIPLVDLSPLTYFARATRASLVHPGAWPDGLLPLTGLAIIVFALGILAVPWRS